RSLRRLRRFGLAEIRVACRQRAVFRPAPLRDPAAHLEAQLERRVERATVGAGLAAGDDALWDHTAALAASPSASGRRQAAVAPGSSIPGKKNPISARAVSGPSEPWAAFCSTSVPNSPRIVPFGA